MKEIIIGEKNSLGERVGSLLARLDTISRDSLKEQLDLVKKEFPQVYQDATRRIDIFHGRVKSKGITTIDTKGEVIGWEVEGKEIFEKYKNLPQEKRPLATLFYATLNLYAFLMNEESIWNLRASRGTPKKKS